MEEATTDTCPHYQLYLLSSPYGKCPCSFEKCEYFPPPAPPEATEQKATQIKKTFKKQKTIYQWFSKNDRVTEKVMQAIIKPPYLATLNNDSSGFSGIVAYEVINYLY